MRQRKLFFKAFQATSGFTLIEMVISMLIVSIALLGVTVVLRTVIFHSADPMITQQAIAIGDSYLEEISGKAFPTTTPCPAPVGVRSTYSNVCDYNGLSQVPTNELGNAIAGLGAYNVAVTVDTSTSGLSGLTAGTQIVRVDVTVSRANMPTQTYSVYRANY